MANSIESIKHCVMIRFGLSSNEPTDEQLSSILREIKIYREQGYTNSQIDQKLPDIVKKYCSSFEKYIYAAEDISDLIDIMIHLLDSLKK